MTCVHRLIQALTVAMLASTTGSCLGVKPVVVDRHAQLENQILGRLQRLESELVLASSVRGQQDAPPPSGLHREAAEAAMRRAFNADDIQRFKHDQVIGEGRDGRLELLSQHQASRKTGWLPDLVAQENHDRAVLMRRVIQLDSELSDEDLPLVRHVFHRLLVRTARPGDRIQGADGRWLTVQGPSKPAEQPPPSGNTTPETSAP